MSKVYDGYSWKPLEKVTRQFGIEFALRANHKNIRALRKAKKRVDLTLDPVWLPRGLTAKRVRACNDNQIA